MNETLETDRMTSEGGPAPVEAVTPVFTNCAVELVTPKKLPLTSVVRRGFRQFTDRGLAAHVELIITHNTRLGMKRGEKLTAKDIDELRKAAAWIEQNAAPLEEGEPGL